MKCGNCLRETENPDYCDECFLKIQGLKQPPELQDMEHVYAELAAVTPGQRFMKRLKDDDANKFLDRLQKARDGYRAHLRGLEKTKGPEASDKASEPQAVDEGSDRCLELIDKMLADAKRDSEAP